MSPKKLLQYSLLEADTISSENANAKVAEGVIHNSAPLPQNNNKFYAKSHILVMTFFFGPVAWAYALYANFKHMNSPKTNTALWIGIAFNIIVLWALVVGPTEIVDKIPTTLIPFINMWLAYLIVERHQKDELNNQIRLGASYHSGWNTFRVGLACVLLSFIFSFMLIFVSGFLMTTSWMQ